MHKRAGTGSEKEEMGRKRVSRGHRARRWPQLNGKGFILCSPGLLLLPPPHTRRELEVTVDPQGLPAGLDSKEFACNAGDPGSIPGQGRSLEEKMATHSSILDWSISWTERPSRL